jgi:hypothetical protein
LGGGGGGSLGRGTEKDLDRIGNLISGRVSCSEVTEVMES